MVRVTVRVLALLALVSAPALAGSIQTPLPGDGFCTVNSGLDRSTVVCDYAGGFSLRYGRDVRVRVLLMLKRRGQLECAVTDVYDPTIPTIRDGRILDTQTRCYR